MKLTRYKIFCVTENSWKEWFLPETSASPTACPDNTAHSVDVTQTAMIEKEDADEVVTQFEKNDKDLKLASGEAAVDANTGAAVIEIPVGSGGRYIDEGVAWFDVPHAQDRITAIEGVTAVDLPADALFPGCPALPAGTSVKTYHDDEISAEFQGWRIPFKRGHIEIDTMAGYGFIPEVLKLKITAKKGGDAPFTGSLFVNVKWGKKG